MTKLKWAIQAINIGTAPDQCSNVVVRYNTVAQGVATFDCTTSTGAPGSLVHGSILSMGAAQAAVASHNGFRPDSSVSGTDSVQCAPSYVNAALFDCHLSALDTYARGRGDPARLPPLDIDGQARPLGDAPEAGADEVP